MHCPQRHQRSAPAAVKLDPLELPAAGHHVFMVDVGPTEQHQAVVAGRIIHARCDALPGLIDFQALVGEATRPSGRQPGPTLLPARRSGRRGACGSRPAARAAREWLPAATAGWNGPLPQRSRPRRHGARVRTSDGQGKCRSCPSFSEIGRGLSMVLEDSRGIKSRNSGPDLPGDGQAESGAEKSDRKIEEQKNECGSGVNCARPIPAEFGSANSQGALRA